MDWNRYQEARQAVEDNDPLEEHERRVAMREWVIAEAALELGCDPSEIDYPF